MITPSMYARQWFITVFAYSFLFHLTLRVWDVFLYEGIKVVFQFVLALLRFCHDGLLLQALRNSPRSRLIQMFYCQFPLHLRSSGVLQSS
uniref:Rab-GAP TBC domain-containing protein n=2 Tax=Setaria italica TaxID=4555 RepID=K3YNK2_SETIT